jgi:cytochrome c biogenesis protein CcmG/thiol:disulfide interchange protein DsbE
LALDWLRRLGDPYVTVAYDPEGNGSLDWGVYGSPETFLMDPQGIIVLRAFQPDPTWEPVVEAFLASFACQARLP